jgi:hypothetical protein
VIGTPKRLLLLVLGFLLVFLLFQGYVFFFGHYDGLPPLPQEYLPAPEGVEPVPWTSGARPNQAVARLVEAFGPMCEEQFRRIKLEWRLQGLVVAADRWQLLDNGQLRLHKVSVAIFGKPKPEQPGVEINTVRGEMADIEFDKPLTDPRDAFTSRPIGGKLIGKGMKVELRNNRRTLAPEDDVRLYTDWLAYSDPEHRIWTHAEVRLVDSEPEQARVAALGMEISLIPGQTQRGKAKRSSQEKAGDKPEAAAPSSLGSGARKNPIAGVRWLRLDREVSMTMLLDAKTAFLGASAEPSAPAATPQESSPASTPAQAASQKKTPIVVTSRGPFLYDVESDRAEFRDKVAVIRKVEAPVPSSSENTDAVRYDQLDCDHLVLFFQWHKGNASLGPSRQEEAPLELLRVEARGSPLELSSDGERLRATGSHLIYDQISKETRLTGQPIQAERDGNELQVQGTLVFSTPAASSQEIRNVRAEGPGEVRIRNLEPLSGGAEPAASQAIRPQPLRVARWDREMRLSRDGTTDRLDFLGRASFEDAEHGVLRADRIAVWLEGRNPQRMDAVHNVSLESRDLRILQCDQLRVQVEQAPVPANPQAVRNPAGPAAPPGPDVGWKPLAPPGEPTQPAGDSRRGPQPGLLPDAKDVAKEPFEVRARIVDVKLAQRGRFTELRQVRTEGQVVVTRKPGPGKEAGVSIRADRLDLLHGSEGSVLKVAGQPGYVQVGELTLLGSVVNLDQPANHAWVNGSGSLKLPARTDFQGNTLPEPTEVTIYWTERMFFDGKIAEFDGNVQAQQGQAEAGGARIACQKLEVVLDRALSLKNPPQSPEPPAALYRMLCDRDCRLEKGTREGNRWLSYQRIEAREVLFDNPSSQLTVYGPGVVTMLHEGYAGGFAGELSARGPQRPPPSGEPETARPGVRSKSAAGAKASEMKLTRIQFDGHLQANRASGVVIFTDRVQLTHVPAQDPDADLNLDRLPVGGIWLACNRLKAVSRRLEDKSVAQEFEASERVRILGRLASGEFSGQADVVKYVESKDLLILEGVNGNLATLTRQVAPGRPKEPVKARRIWYWRSQNQVRLDETDQIQVNP